MIQRGTALIANTENCILVKGTAFSCVVELVAKGNKVSSLKGLKKPLGFNSGYSAPAGADTSGEWQQLLEAVNSIVYSIQEMQTAGR